ncbi:MAG TPA: zinc-binding dehydrogenase [Thermodesulfobacteriota bacterium]|nr:zinc-binding dehydrogenase [Thermodesulfobacteriota bacterium]
MKAIIYYEFGGVEVLRFEDVPKPEVGDNEVLVRVKAASLNHLDLRLRSGKSPRPVDLPHIGGVDIAGEVAEVGGKVTGLTVGTRVVIDPSVRCGKCRFCQAGESNFCVSTKVIGVNIHGGFAEYVKVPAANAVPIPDNLSYNDASALPICFVTAWYGLFERGGLKPGETVLVHAAGSGTGSAAVQVASLSGAHVIATAGTDEKLAKARELGAHETINYNRSDFAEEVKRITNKNGVDLIFDQIGASVWDKNIQSLAPRGRLLLVGVVGGGTTQANLGPIIVRDVSILGVTVFNAPRRDLATVVNLASLGRLRPVIDKTFPLKDAAEAQRLLEDRNQFGKVILNP